MKIKRKLKKNISQNNNETLTIDLKKISFVYGCAFKVDIDFDVVNDKMSELYFVVNSLYCSALRLIFM